MDEQIKKWLAPGAIVFLVLVLLANSLGVVMAGQRGVLLRFGAVNGKVLEEGLYFKIPFIEVVQKMDVQMQKEQVHANAASRDLQQVHTEIALNFHLKPEVCAKMYQEVGREYKSRVIDPTIQEIVKSVTSTYTAEELVTHREKVREDMIREIEGKLEGRGIKIDAFNIIDFNFSKTFNEAIEAKVTAEQSALAAKNKLEQVRFEAEQAIVEARGKAEALRIEGMTLKANPEIIKLRAIEKWDGILPKVTGGATPMVDLK